MRRLRSPKREWARFGAKAGAMVGFALILATVFGIYRVEGDDYAPEVKDGDLLVYVRFLPPEVGELAVDGGRIVRAEESRAGRGKVIWSIRVRDI